MSVEPRERFAAFPPPDRGAPASDFRLAGRLVRPALNRVETSEAAVSLEPKVMRVLLALARRPGEVVTKEELFRDVWDGAFVSEDVLTRAIGELRRLFGDDAASPRVIETIRKSGYRLIAPMAPPAAAEPADVPVVAAPTDRRGVVAAAAIAVAAAIGVAFLLRTSPRRDAAPLRVRPLTTYPGNERDPALSPDGTRVAFAWNGGSGEAMSLYVQMVGGENPLRLTRDPSVEDRTPAWSPDGKRLAFTRATRSDCRIFLVSALGGEERPLAPCGDAEYRRVAWSPDGRWLALSRRDTRGVLALELLSPETLERRPVTRAPDGFLGDTSPAFSPDGQTLAFTRNRTDGVNDIYRVAISGGDPVRLTFDDRDTMGSDWSADGRSILFSSSRAGIYSLWRVPSKGGEPSWVAGGGIKMKHPSASRQGNLVAFENWLYEINLWRVPARSDSGAGPPRRLTEATDEWNFGPSLSADGARVVFVSTRSGSEEIWIAGSDGAGARRLTSFGGARLESPRLSPDGRRIVFSARAPARSSLYLVSADGGVPERLTDDTSDALAPRWSRDGRAIYFASRRSGAWQVWRLALDGRGVSPMTTAGGYAAQESPDGRSLYFTRADAAGIWRMSLPAGEHEGEALERVTDRLAPEDWANWEIGAAGIYFRELCPRHEGPAVALLPWGAPAPRDLAPLVDQGWSGFAVSADGEWIVYPRVDRHTCDIRAIENPA